jgi:hypothetical protein
LLFVERKWTNREQVKDVPVMRDDLGVVSFSLWYDVRSVSATQDSIAKENVCVQKESNEQESAGDVYDTVKEVLL